MKPTCIPDKLYEAQKDVFDAVIAEVIEACAKVCDEQLKHDWNIQHKPALVNCAAAIRSQNTQQNQ